MTWFFEGLPPGQAVPWGEWILPLFWWLSFIGAAACVSICLAVLLRRQWVDHERLVYPLANVGGGSGLGAKTRDTDDWGKAILGRGYDGIWDDCLEHPVVFFPWGTQISHGQLPVWNVAATGPQFSGNPDQTQSVYDRVCVFCQSGSVV